LYTLIGYKKIIADKKRRGIMNVTEGKRPLSFPGYHFLANMFMTLTPSGKKYPFKEAIFSWCFLLLSWNLIARCSNIRDINLAHLDWVNDSLLVTFAQSKGDQDGSAVGNEKHVYANPMKPDICCILALAILIFCRRRNLGEEQTRENNNHSGRRRKKQKSDDNNNNFLFTYDNVEKFGIILKKVLNDTNLVPDSVDLGAKKKDLGSHSNRKGAGTWLLGLTICLSAVAIFLRAGWSLGNVQDRYIFAGAGQDQMVGRTASGLPINDKRFAILPPHFSKEDLRIIADNIGWSYILEEYNLFPDCFKRVVPYLLASIIFHVNYLRENLDENHPIWNQRIFTQPVVINRNESQQTFRNIVEAFEDKILTGYYNCEDSDMQATGIPHHLIIQSQIIELQNRVAQLEERVLNDSKERGEKILEKLDKLPLAVKDSILSNFVVDGVVPVNMNDIRTLLDINNKEIMEELKRLLPSVVNINNNNSIMSIENNSNNNVNDTKLLYKHFTWGGKFRRMIPKDFVFPTCDFKTAYDLYFHGNSNLGVRPYYFLNGRIYEQYRGDLHGKDNITNFNRVKNLIEYLLDIAVQETFINSKDEVKVMSVNETDELFQKSFPIIIRLIYGENANSKVGKRAYEIKYSTITNKLASLISNTNND
jgi:hypothetical protein